MNYSDFFTLLEWDLKQESEEGDYSNSDFKKLREDIGKIIVSETIDELVMENPKRFLSIEKHHFDGYTKYWKLPDHYHMLFAYKNSSDQWQRVSDNSDSTAEITLADSDTIYNSNGWQRGDELFVKVAKFPSPIIDDSDPVDVPRGLMRYLRLEIIAKVLGRDGKAMSDETREELLRARMRFMKSSTKVQTRSFIAFNGHGLGNG